VLPFVTNSLKDARELLYSGKTVDAATAAEMGLVNRVVPEGELDATVETEVAAIKKTPSTAVAIAKDMLNDVQETQGSDGTAASTSTLALSPWNPRLRSDFAKSGTRRGCRPPSSGCTKPTKPE